MPSVGRLSYNLEGELITNPSEGRGQGREEPKILSICLLPIIWRLFEKLLKMPNRHDIGAAKDLRSAVRIYAGQVDGGCGRGAAASSCLQREVALLFNISSTFDNVWWPLVLQRLKSRECPKNVFEVLRSYFDKRQVSISIGDTKEIQNGQLEDVRRVRAWLTET